MTAKIGKELLDQNVKLQKTIDTLQKELKCANEKVTQLTHENSSKTDLINILTNDVDECSTNEDGVTPVRQITLEMLQRKIGSLEEQNKSLKTEYDELLEQADDVEAREKSLLSEMLGELCKCIFFNLALDNNLFFVQLAPILA